MSRLIFPECADTPELRLLQECVDDAYRLLASEPPPSAAERIAWQEVYVHGGYDWRSGAPRADEAKRKWEDIVAFLETGNGF